MKEVPNSIKMMKHTFVFIFIIEVIYRIISILTAGYNAPFIKESVKGTTGVEEVEAQFGDNIYVYMAATIAVISASLAIIILGLCFIIVNKIYKGNIRGRGAIIIMNIMSVYFIYRGVFAFLPQTDNSYPNVLYFILGSAQIITGVMAICFLIFLHRTESAQWIRPDKKNQG